MNGSFSFPVDSTKLVNATVTIPMQQNSSSQLIVANGSVYNCSDTATNQAPPFTLSAQVPANGELLAVSTYSGMDCQSKVLLRHILLSAQCATIVPLAVHQCSSISVYQHLCNSWFHGLSVYHVDNDSTASGPVSGVATQFALRGNICQLAMFCRYKGLLVLTRTSLLAPPSTCLVLSGWLVYGITISMCDAELDSQTRQCHSRFVRG